MLNKPEGANCRTENTQKGGLVFIVLPSSFYFLVRALLNSSGIGPSHNEAKAGEKSTLKVEWCCSGTLLVRGGKRNGLTTHLSRQAKPRTMGHVRKP